MKGKCPQGCAGGQDLSGALQLMKDLKCYVHCGEGKRDFQEGQRARLLLGKGIRAREPDAPGLPTNQDENQGIRASVVHMAPSRAMGPDPTNLILQLGGHIAPISPSIMK